MKSIGLRTVISSTALASLLLGCGPQGDAKSPADTNTDSDVSVSSVVSTAADESDSTEADDADLEKQDGESDTERARRLANNTETRTNQVIADTVAKNRTDIRGCYEAALKRTAIEGKVTITFTVDPSGKVSEARLTAELSDFRDPGFSECATQAVKRIQFPASSRGRETTVNFPFHFKP